MTTNLVNEKGTSVYSKKALLRVAFVLLVFALSITILAACAVDDPSEAQVSGTGIPVASEFQSFYDDKGGLRVFGYPITDPYEDFDREVLVQYFQRMRLELDPDSGQVLIYPLGEWAYEGSTGAAEEDLIGEETPGEEFTIEDEFLTFYRAADGQALFGNPISPQVNEGGTRVQYFDNACLEWHPEAPLDYRVQVGPLGEAHYRLVGIFENPGRSRPLDSAAVNEAVILSNVIAPILYRGDEQTIFVDVMTPEGQRPVTGVTVDAAVNYNGLTKHVELPDTDGAGQSKGVLDLDNIEPGQKVQVEITVSAPGGAEIGATTLSFMSWW